MTRRRHIHLRIKAGAEQRFEHEAGVHMATVMRLEAESPLALPAKGTSMLPVFLPGEIVSVERLDPEAELAVGTVVAFASFGKLLTHRYIGNTDEGLLLTKGDTRLEADAALERSRIVGLVTQVRGRGRQRDVPVDAGAAGLSWALGNWFGHWYPSRVPLLRECVRLAYIVVTFLIWPYRRRLAETTGN